MPLLGSLSDKSPLNLFHFPHFKRPLHAISFFMLIFYVHPLFWCGSLVRSQEAMMGHSVNQALCLGCSLAQNTERMVACVLCADMSSSVREPYLSVLWWLSDLLLGAEVCLKLCGDYGWHPEADLYWSSFVWLHLRGRKGNGVWQSSWVCRSDILWGNWWGLQIAGTRGRIVNPYNVLRCFADILRHLETSVNLDPDVTKSNVHGGSILQIEKLDYKMDCCGLQDQLLFNDMEINNILTSEAILIAECLNYFLVLEIDIWKYL